VKKCLQLVLVSATLLVMTAGAHAGVTADSYSVSPFIGGYSFLGHEHLATRPVYGVRAGYNFTPHFGIEAVADYARTERLRPEGGDVDSFNYHLDMLYHFMPQGPLVPYLAAGYGWNSREYPGDVDTTRPVFNYGFGLKYFLSEALAVRGDFRHLLPRHDEQTFHDLEYSVGVDFLFGHKQAKTGATAAQSPEEAPLEEGPATEPGRGRYKYCVTLHGEFDIDRTVIRQEEKDEIAVVGEFMKKYPSTTAVLEGYTDNVGDADYNLKLSRRRAEAVARYLEKNYGIEPSRLATRGFGKSHPVADNATDAGKQKNRRVEAIIDCAFDVSKVRQPERLCMGLVIDFDTASSEIKPAYRDEIAKVAEYLKSYPTTTGVIEGHTDNVGGYDFNMRLSQERAERVVDYLVENFGIDRARLSAKGYGYTRRIAYNSTAEGRAMNRRINAVIDCVVEKK